MMENPEILEFKQKGYDSVYIWDAVPNEEDPDHTHSFDTHLKVLSGEIEIVIYDEIKILKINDEIDIPREVVHSGKAGVNGCKYIVAEKH